MIPNTWQIFHSSAADHYYRVFLQIMTFARDVGGYFNTVR